MSFIWKFAEKFGKMKIVALEAAAFPLLKICVNNLPHLAAVPAKIARITHCFHYKIIINSFPFLQNTTMLHVIENGHHLGNGVIY